MDTEPGKFIYRVKQLTGEVRSLLESSYRSIWVEGEISGLATPASGHAYFSLKDENAIIRCAFFRNRRTRNSPAPSDGMQVLLCGQISYYEPRGDLQFIVSYMEEAGEGALRRAFELLKQKLAAEGLFEQLHKSGLPAYPKSIGVITSDTGAAMHDILVTLKRRYPVASVILYPTLVQGVAAPQNIVEALDLAEKRQETDVIILSRGGGSLEDLQAFNDEEVARRLFRCTIPIVCGVGHEVDFTICDFVADQRAPTPTAAAELVTPNIQQLEQGFVSYQSKIHESTVKYVRDFQQTIDYMTSRLVHPEQKLARYHSEHKHLSTSLIVYNQIYMNYINNLLYKLSSVLSTHSPAVKMGFLEQRIDAIRQALRNQIDTHLNYMRHLLTQYQSKIRVMSPEHTLHRGYAIVQNRARKVITDPKQTELGESLRIRVFKGQIKVVVDDV